MSDNRNELKYILGLDVGVSSLGWSIVDAGFEGDKYFAKKLIDTGVRVWTSAENPKNGESLNKSRRDARSLRRQTRRKRARRNILKSILLSQNLLSSINDLEKQYEDVWALRSTALDQLLTDLQLSKVLLHLIKRRGFKSNRKSDLEKEGGGFKEIIEATQQKIASKDYRTFGEMVCKSEDYKIRKRNSTNNFILLATRKELLDELTLILKTQKELGNNKITDKFITKVIKQFTFQRPFTNKKALEELVGFCTFYKEEKRLAKHTLTAEKFILYSKLNNIRVRTEGEYEERPLSSEHKLEILNLVLKKGEVKYSDIRKALKLPFTVLFNINYYIPKSEQIKTNFTNKEEEYKYIEAKIRFIRLDGIKTLRKLQIFNYLFTNENLYDSVVEVLVFNKNVETIRNELKILIPDIQESDLNYLSDIDNFKGFINLSKKAVIRLLPLLEEGLTYDKAVEEGIEPQFRIASKTFGKYLPAIDTKEIRNSVVLRSLCQTRIVINKIIKEYGSPAFVHIELARDLVKDFNERKRIEREQEERAIENEKIKNELMATFGVKDPKGIDILKYKLWKSQDSRCAYSMASISAGILFSDNNATQIDHILPFSRSFNDSNNNKVLVLSSANQNKRDRTPYEFIGEGKTWNDLTIWWQSLYASHKINLKKLQFLTITKFQGGDLTQFIARDLNDTRYITRYLKNLIENSLTFAEIPEYSFKRRVFTYTGMFTSILRKYYGFNKVREENLRHHALDAVVVAVATQSNLQRVSKFFKSQEDHDYIINKTKNYFPEPWNKFTDDVITRIFKDNPLEEIKNLGLQEHYGDAIKYIRPLFVSRKPNIKNSGAIHAQTIMAVKNINGKDYFIKRIPIEKLTEKNFPVNKIEGSIYGEGKNVVAHIKDRLIKYNWKAEDAFKEPIYKPAKVGAKQKNQIKHVKVVDGPANQYFEIKAVGGVAVNDSMLRIDIFKKNGKFYVVPVYMKDIIDGRLPNVAILSGKPKEKWEIMNQDAVFQFSLYPKEYVIVDYGNKQRSGYYVQYGVNVGQYVLQWHDKEDKLTGYFSNAKSIKKIYVSPLGKKYYINKEKRHGIQIHSNNKTK